ncbi:hypothetical protein BDY24DRAFT_79933 [Mrakia frigida]|uniref:uncharacterized protein n=1 Tax=Mrakia frigida TaxID=29902 RepID=UPI003FCBF01D
MLLIVQASYRTSSVSSPGSCLRLVFQALVSSFCTFSFNHLLHFERLSNPLSLVNAYRTPRSSPPKNGQEFGSASVPHRTRRPWFILVGPPSSELPPHSPIKLRPLRRLGTSSTSYPTDPCFLHSSRRELINSLSSLSCVSRRTDSAVLSIYLQFV